MRVLLLTMPQTDGVTGINTYAESFRIPCNGLHTHEALEARVEAFLLLTNDRLWPKAAPRSAVTERLVMTQSGRYFFRAHIASCER